MKNIGYLTWAGYNVAGMPLAQFTHMIGPAVIWTSNTNPTLKGEWGNMSVFTTIVSVCHAAGVKIMPYLGSINGGNTVADLTTLIANGYLGTLATNIKNMIVTYNFDGVELDIEAIGDVNQTSLGALVDTLYTLLNPLGKTLSLTGMAGKWYPDISPSKISKLDWIDVMTYDINADYPSPSSHSAYQHSLYSSTVAVMNKWLGRAYGSYAANSNFTGFPAAKLHMGIPFYGYNTALAEVNYSTILTAINPVSSLDEAVVNGSTTWWNGIDTVKAKVQWAKDNNLGGIFNYAMPYDALSDSRSLAKAIYNVIGGGMIVSSHITTNLLDTTYGTDGALQVNAIPYGKITHLVYGSNPTNSDGTLTWYGDSYRGTVMAKIHAAGGKFEECIDDYSGYLDSNIIGDSTLTTPSATLAAYINNIKTQLTKNYSGHTADGVYIDFESSLTMTTAHMDIFITHLYNVLNPIGKTIAEYAGYYYRWYPGHLPSASIVNTKLSRFEIGCYYLFTAAEAITGMEYWLNYSGYSKSKLVCLIQSGVVYMFPDGSSQYYGMYSDLWNTQNNLGLTDTGKYSQYFTDFYTNKNPDPGSLAASGWYYGINKTLQWHCVDETKTLTSWLITNGYAGIGIWSESFDMISSTKYSLLRNIYETLIGGFPAGSIKTANIQVTVKPPALSYQIELWLGPDTNTKSATSGRVNYTATGNEQSVALSITMPDAGTYNVYVDIYAGGNLVKSIVYGTPVVVV
jgi:hypothetical protein